MSRNYYMHTLNRRPAWFDGWQVVFWADKGRTPEVAGSLEQIRREQELSRQNRIAEGFDEQAGVYGYVRFRIPEDA